MRTLFGTTLLLSAGLNAQDQDLEMGAATPYWKIERLLWIIERLLWIERDRNQAGRPRAEPASAARLYM